MVRRLIAMGARYLALLALAFAVPVPAMAQPHTIGPLRAQANLSDLDNAATARSNLGLGGLATLAPDGNASHFLNGLGQWATPAGGSASAGGSSGQLQYNNAGALAGVTLGGDCTLDVSTGVVTCTKTAGTAFGPLATAAIGNGLVLFGGTLSIALPSATTLGGVESLTAASHQFLTGISTAGVPQAAQPAAADISGLAASATTDTTNAANITSGTLGAARLPTPTAATLGGVESLTAGSHQFLTGISIAGVPQAAQPAAADISGLAASATVDTTNAANITSGTLGAARLPTPTAGTLGGVESLNAASHQFLTGISLAGVPQAAQPAAADISGLAASATTDTTDAANISGGTLSAARLPNTAANALNIGNGAAVETDTLTAGANVTITRNSGAVTIAASASGGPPIAAGSYYMQPSSTSSVSNTNTVGVMATPLWITKAQTIHSLSVSLGPTVNPGTLCLGIAPDNGSGAPGTLAQQACQAIGAGNVNSTVTLTITAYAVQPGLYWLEQSSTAVANAICYLVPAGSGNYGFNGLQQYVGAATLSGLFGQTVLGYYSSDTPGASLPSTLTGLTVNEGVKRPFAVGVQF